MGLYAWVRWPSSPFAAFAAFVKRVLSCPGVRFSDAGKPVRKVAVGGGSCGSEIGDVIAAGCDTFVTADLKYNHFEEAKYCGLNLIDAGHFETENPICDVLEGILREAFRKFRFSARGRTGMRRNFCNLCGKQLISAVRL